MGDDYVTHGAALRIGGSDTEATSVDCYALVNQKAGQPLRRIGAAAGVK